MKRRVWIAFGVVILVNFLLLFAQTAASFWKLRHTLSASWLFPEARYYLQSFVLLLPLVPMTLLRFRNGKGLLVVLLSACVVHAAVFLVKAHIPGTRRQAYISACDWAVERIRADYKGPTKDVGPFFTWIEYHPLARPCVEAHVTRVPYLLGGRGASVVGCGVLDTPDYIVDEPHKVNRDWWTVARYEKLAEEKFGKRDFVIYKRVK